MLDPKQLRVGSVVRMEGVIAEIKQHDLGLLHKPHFYEYGILFNGGSYLNGPLVSEEAMQHAELVSTPVTFSAEQIAAIKEAAQDAFKPGKVFIAIERDWLESHEDKSRLE